MASIKIGLFTNIQFIKKNIDFIVFFYDINVTPSIWKEEVKRLAYIRTPPSNEMHYISISLTRNLKSY